LFTILAVHDIVNDMKFKFNLKIGKLYYWRIDPCEELIYNFKEKNGVRKEFVVKNLVIGDYVVFLERPKSLGNPSVLWCKVITEDAIIGYIIWDHYSYDSFAPYEENCEKKL